MSTNFYLNTGIIPLTNIQVVKGGLGELVYLDNGFSIDTHIGKRLASGAYCWACRKTLCVDGEKAIHRGKATWSNKCPDCGALFSDRRDANHAVSYSCSFSWTISPLALHMIVAPAGLNANCIIDDYNRKMTIQEFFQILLECPIQFSNFSSKSKVI